MKNDMRKFKDISKYFGLIKAIKEHFGPSLKAVILFGSQARREARASSDHDILIIADDLPLRPLERMRLIRNLISDVPLKLNTIAKTPAELDKNLTPLMLEAGFDGICLFGEEFFYPYQLKIIQVIKQAGLERKKTGEEWYWQFNRPPQKAWEISWDGYREI